MIQIITFIAITHMFICVITLSVALCLYVTECVTDLEKNLYNLKKLIISMEMKPLDARARIEAMKKLAGLIQFYSEARQLSA